MKPPAFLNLTEDEIAKRGALSRAAKPKLAATLLLYQGVDDNPKVLMGQRAKKHDFMPSIYVFPGGRVDRSDSYAPSIGRFSQRTHAILRAALPQRRARALVLAAIRETFEETGLMIGQKQTWGSNINNPSWDTFRAAQIMPDLSAIEVIGRAITPPHRHKRFDTWFLAQRFDGDVTQITDSIELNNVGWYDLAALQKLESHRITQMMFTNFQKFLSNPSRPAHIPFSRMLRGRFKIGSFPDLP